MKNLSTPLAPVSELRQAELTLARDRLFITICALEHEIGCWLTTPAAWNKRNHASIRQFLADVREFSSALGGGANPVAPAIILAATERLAAKVRDAAVYQRVDDLHLAFAAYLLVLRVDDVR
jgi:hypothetical protein